MAVIFDLSLICICYYQMCFYHHFAFEVVMAVLMLWMFLTGFLSVYNEERDKLLVILSFIPAFFLKYLMLADLLSVVQVIF